MSPPPYANLILISANGAEVLPSRFYIPFVFVILPELWTGDRAQNEYTFVWTRSLSHGICVMKEMIPSEFHLSQNYPNPCCGKTTIKFCIAHKTRVKLDVLNPEYKMIARLVDEECEAGTYEAIFNASDVPEGGYVYIFQAGDNVITKRMAVKR